MGLADQIVMMAFGLILGSAAVATALAFGLGGRDAAARMLEQWQRRPDARRARRPAAAPAASAPRRADDSQPPLGVSDAASTAFVAIDWSGAKGRRHKGIAIAEARGDERRRAWSGPAMSGRARKCSTGCSKRAAQEPTLFGFDFSFAPPFVERGEYLPGEPGVPDDGARILGLCRCASATTRTSAPRASSRQAHRRHFYFGIADGVKADFVHFRQCDARAERAGRPQDRQRL